MTSRRNRPASRGAGTALVAGVLSPFVFLARPATADAPPVRFAIKKAGNVSAALYNSEGRMVRELARAQPSPAGTVTFPWDGLDQSGQPLPPGQYTWKALVTQGLKSEYLMSLGTSMGSQWTPGNHSGPMALAVADDSYISAAATEGPPEISRTTFDGKVVWNRGSFEPARAPRDIAVGNGLVYYLQNNGKIHLLDLGTGASTQKPISALVPVLKHDFTNLIGDSAQEQEVTLDVPNGKYFLRFTHGDEKAATGTVELRINGAGPPAPHRVLPDKMAWWEITPLPAGPSKNRFLPQIYGNPAPVDVKDGKLRLRFMPRGKKGDAVHWNVSSLEVFALPDCVAVRGDQLVVASAGAGTVMWVDPKNGEVQSRVPLPEVQDIAFGPDGTLYGLLPGQIVVIGQKTSTPAVRAKGLLDPKLLSVDQQSGDFLVAEAGPRIRRYASSGKMLRSYGREGGRQDGPYDNRDFATVTGLAADGQGGFLVAEGRGAPRRVARFDATGKATHEWFGPTGFYPYTSLDPKDPTIGWLRQDGRSLLKIKIDYGAGTWKVLSAYQWEKLLDPAFFPKVSEYTHLHCLRRDLDGDGHEETLIWSRGLPGLLMVEDEKRQVIRPLAATGKLDPEFLDEKKPLPVEKLPLAWLEAIAAAGADINKPGTRTEYGAYFWADVNGDGLMQGNEFQLRKARPGTARTVMVDGDLSLWQGGYHAELGGIYQKFPVARYTPAGAPVWNPDSVERGPKTTYVAETAALRRHPSGDRYLLLRGTGDGIGLKGTYDIEAHGWAWPANLLDSSLVQRLDARDEPVWQSGFKAARWPHPRGQLMAPRNINGFVRGCVAIGDQVEQPCEFWTEDGLYVGGLFDGRSGKNGSLPGGEPDRRYTWLSTKAKRIGISSFDEMALFAADDMLLGGEVAELPDGSVVYMGQGNNNNPCYRITGWQDWERSSGRVALAAAAKPAAASGQGLSGEYFSSPDFQTPAAIGVDGPLGFGNKQKWPGNAPQSNFSVRWTGSVEPRFSEDYTFSVYFSGECRLWVDGKEVAWAEQDYPRSREIKKRHSVPLPLIAGRKVPVRLEYRATQGTPVLHFNWESLSQPVQRIPKSALYTP